MDFSVEVFDGEAFDVATATQVHITADYHVSNAKLCLTCLDFKLHVVSFWYSFENISYLPTRTGKNTCEFRT